MVAYVHVRLFVEPAIAAELFLCIDISGSLFCFSSHTLFTVTVRSIPLPFINVNLKADKMLFMHA